MTEALKRPPSFLDRIAIKKLKADPAWELYRWEKIGTTDDLMVTGAVPRLLKSGPRKGRKTWDGKGQSVCVTQEEMKAEFLLYEAESGNCHKCGGSGQEWVGWSATDGTKYQSCRTCNGTGKPKGGAA